MQSAVVLGDQLAQITKTVVVPELPDMRAVHPTGTLPLAGVPVLLRGRE